LVPIPLHKSKEKERGFNQARLIAQALSRVTGAPLGDLLVRVKKTKQQAQTPRRSDRNQNTARAFECPIQTEVDPKTLVVLVDDVITSGSTIIAAAHALRRRGISHVWGLGLAQEDWRGRGY
jgi:ComF family protein